VEFVVIAGDVTQIKSDAIIVSFFEGMNNLDGEIASIDSVLNGVISRLIKNGQIKGKLNEVNVIHNMCELAADRVVIIGLGKREELTTDKFRSAIATACRKLSKQRVEDIAIVDSGSGVNDITPENSAQVITEGALLGLYSFRRHITQKEDEQAKIRKLTLVCGKETDIYLLKKGGSKGRILAEAANFARDMVNEPANYMTPRDMATMAGKIAKEYNLELSVLEKEEMQKLSMGALLGVAQGSCQPPKLIVINYKGRKTGGIDLALIGKGITFDSGGISIKPSNKMDEMKTDMAGGAVVMAAITAIARFKPKINVMVIVPAVENLPSGRAMKPGDILTAMTGTTIEIISTDAEGRLILADAIGYANKLKVKRIVDVATLTGACQVALGSICTGVFGNNQQLIDKIVATGTEAGELMWQMPMDEEYKEQNKSDIADIKNAAKGGAGAITAAQFLAEFVGDTPWVHLDIAGTSFGAKERKYYPKGATGVPVRSLVNLVLDISSQK
jgi:leucyl aminopeptidase